MNLTSYTIFDRVTGEVKNSGSRQAEHMPQATATHDVLVGVRVNPNTHRINPATRRPNLLKVTKREAWRDSLPPSEPSEAAVILEAMKTKLTSAELAAARANLSKE